MASTGDLTIGVNVDFGVLTERALVAHRGGRVVALDPSAIGRHAGLRAESPGTESDALEGGLLGAPAIAIVDIRGPLSQRAERFLCGESDGYDAIESRFAHALSVADAVLLRIDSPGGDYAGLEQAVERMRSMRGDKPVGVYVDEQAASAAYWIASGLATEWITVPPSGDVGSIGVIGAWADERKALESEGIAMHVMREPPGKAAAASAAPVEAVADARLATAIGEAAMAFFGAVERYRPALTAERVRGFDGATFSGQAAVDAGLADHVGTQEQAIERLVAAVRDKRMDEQMKTKLAEAEARLHSLEQELADLLSLTGQESVAAALATAKAWRESHQKAAEDNARMADELAAKAHARRIELIAESVVLGYETPVTAWEDADTRTPKAELTAMPLEALEARVAVQRENPRAFQSATAVRGSVSSSLLELARKRGADPEKVAAVRAQFRTVRGGQS